MMKYSAFEFITILVLVYVLELTSCKNTGASNEPCPNPNTCSRTSSLSDLVCFSSDKANGLRYGFFDFNNGIIPFCRIQLDCELGEKAVLHVVAIYGYLVNLTYVQNGNGTKFGSNLWYIDMTEPGCPQVSTVPNSLYVPGGFNPTLHKTLVPRDLAYLIYSELQNRESDYDAQCNVFPSIDGGECSSCYSSKSSENCQKSNYVTSVSLAQAKSCLIYSNSMDRSGLNLVNELGLTNVNCTLPDSQEPGSDPALYRETCATKGGNTFPSCRDVRKSANINDVLKSYGYDRYLKRLDAQKACTISTLWAQGYNKTSKYQNNYSSCNCDSFTSYCSIALRKLDHFVINPFVNTFILLSGYCQTRLKEEMMSQFFKIC